MSWTIKGKPFKITKQPDKLRYNEGNFISSRNDAVFPAAGRTGVPVTVDHAPCGYWWNSGQGRRGIVRTLVPGSRWIDMGGGAYSTIGDLAVYKGDLYASGGSGYQNDTGLTFYKWYSDPGEFRLVCSHNDENSGGRTYLAVIENGTYHGVYMVQDGGWWYAPDSYRWSTSTGYTMFDDHNGVFNSILAILDSYVLGGFGSSLRGTDGIKPFDVLINQNEGNLYSLVVLGDYVYACSSLFDYANHDNSRAGILMRVSLYDLVRKFATPTFAPVWQDICNALPHGSPVKLSVIGSLTVYNNYIYGASTGHNNNYDGYTDYLVRWKPGMTDWEIVIPGTTSRSGPYYCRPMRVFQGKLYSVGYSSDGALYQFQDDTKTWKRVAAKLNNQDVVCLMEWNGDLYGGAYNGHLYKWDSYYIESEEIIFT